MDARNSLVSDMYKNYFFLNRFICEASEILPGKTLSEVFSQDKDKLVLHFTDNSDNLFVEISVNPGNPFILIRNEFHRAKKNSIGFFQNNLPAKINNIEIATNDRVIRITSDKFNLFYIIRGKYTNVFLIEDSNNIESFKSIDDQYGNSFEEESKRLIYSHFFHIPDLSFINKSNFLDEVKKHFPIISKEIIQEYKFRLDNNKSEQLPKTLDEIISSIEDEPITVYYDDLNGDIFLCPDNYQLFHLNEKKVFSNYSEAVQFYIAKKHTYEKQFHYKKLIQKALDRELHKISTKLNNLLNRIENGSNEELYNKLGNLLLININSIYKGNNEVVVEDVYADNQEITITLKENLEPNKQPSYYFDKAKSERISYIKSKELYSKAQNEFKRLQNINDKFLSAEDKQTYLEIMNELKIKINTNLPALQDDIKSKFKHYMIEDKYPLYVGKDSANNDLLTMKFAKQNDYWFHARSVAGSHVVLRVDNPKEAVPKSILKNAASIAAYHSKAKTAGVVPVSYTFKKYVIKKKGMETGKVALLREDVLLVKPEIPSNCTYIQND